MTDEAVDGPGSSYPAAVVPDRLFADDAAEQRWRARFSAVRIGLPDPARDNAERAVYVSNAGGRFELYFWDTATGTRTKATDRPDGTANGGPAPDGSGLFWFDDNSGDEFGSWQWQDFGTGPGSSRPALPDVPPGYPSGLEIGRDIVLAGFTDDDGSRVHLARFGEATRVVYSHEQDAGVGALSRDETLWVLTHSEHGDSRYPALRVLSTQDGAVIGELDDTPGRGLDAVAFAPVPGDTRLLVGHERRGREELLIWDVADGSVHELDIDLPGDISGDFFPDGQALLVLHTHSGRSTVHRYDLASGELTDLPAARGVISGAVARPDGSIWYRWSDAATPPQLRQLYPDGRDVTLLVPDGPPAPGSEAVHDIWTEGPGGTIHSLLARPTAAGEPSEATNRALPTVFYLHGGPASADEDAYEGTRAAWLDAGFQVVQVNYRGSTGYGSAWRDALTERVGYIELSDIAAVHDDLVVRGLVDQARCAVVGHSWGGFLTLLALGTQPGRWAVGVAGVPVADYLAAYEDEMEPLRGYDRALFGGSPEEKPEAYRDSSPLTHVGQVEAPVLVLAGENDPRCPIRQINNYLDALTARSAPFALYRYDAGHGSMVVEEILRQMACEIAFVRDALGMH
ncbi:alpha/beta fold hydrolase [Nakamurella sp. YIM 132087]|uniref:Alpha/beta fold hydrolase n=1 Tax=Nakamurella alba TaxID=2665158 RepID=A0A7K1FSI5_9ACTN|nr:alpha/beta fold hydrolase [Nakamurella alba]